MVWLLSALDAQRSFEHEERLLIAMEEALKDEALFPTIATVLKRKNLLHQLKKYTFYPTASIEKTHEEALKRAEEIFNLVHDQSLFMNLTLANGHHYWLEFYQEHGRYYCAFINPGPGIRYHPCHPKALPHRFSVLLNLRLLSLDREPLIDAMCALLKQQTNSHLSIVALERRLSVRMVIEDIPEHRYLVEHDSPKSTEEVLYHYLGLFFQEEEHYKNELFAFKLSTLMVLTRQGAIEQDKLESLMGDALMELHALTMGKSHKQLQRTELTSSFHVSGRALRH